MKVLLLHRDLAFDGGVGQCFLHFARAHDRAKLRLLVGGLQEAPQGLGDALTELGVPALLFDGDPYAGPAYRLRQAILSEGIEVIAATSFRAYLVAKAAAYRSACRVVFWIHSIPLVMGGAIRRSVFRRMARRDTLIFVSEAVRSEHDFEPRSGTSYVVYNGVEDPHGVEEIEPYGRERRSELGIPADALVVGFTAEFVGWKNHAVLVRAFAEVARSRPDAWLLLTGDGELREATMALARELGVAERVIFPGRRRDARRLLGLMDIYAHPANGEGFGLAAAEAMLAGLPVVVARAGALVEIVQDGKTGLFSAPDDAVSLAAALERLAADPSLRADLGSRARAHGLERFSPERYAASLTDVLLAECPAVRVDADEVTVN